jgi:radical SAM protein with 4Fe4S-binding SPASM domain
VHWPSILEPLLLPGIRPGREPHAQPARRDGERVLLLDGITPPDHFQGCQAGRFVLGIESDGAVKGCPSLQTRSYVGGKLRERPLAEIWNDSPELAFARTRTAGDLWGFCRTCPFAEPCRGGCTFTAHSLFGRPGNNPHCHYRARTLAREGKRERPVPVAAAEGRPFDHALFTIVEEPIDAPDPGATRARESLVQIRRAPKAAARSARGSPDERGRAEVPFERR